MNFLEMFFSHHRVPHTHRTAPTNLDYNFITDGIYIGTNQCCTVGLSEVLKKEGIQADISLENERIDSPFGVEMYVWIPTKDHFPPAPDQLLFGIQTIAGLVAQGKKVYIHCKNGHGRSSTLMIAYLMKYKNMNFDEAFDLIKSQRPGAHIQFSQVEALKVFAATLTTHGN